MWVAALIADVAKDITGGIQQSISMKQQSKDAKSAFESTSQDLDKQYADSKQQYERGISLTDRKLALGQEELKNNKTKGLQGVEDAERTTRDQWGDYLSGQETKSADYERARDVKKVQDWRL